MILNDNLLTLKNNNKKVFRKLKRSCYYNGFMRYACCINPEHYHAFYNIRKEDNKVLSWAIVYSFCEDDNLFMIWTPKRMRKKGYAREILLEISKHYKPQTLSCYHQATQLLFSTFLGEHKKIYDAENDGLPPTIKDHYYAQNESRTVA